MVVAPWRQRQGGGGWQKALVAGGGGLGMWPDSSRVLDPKRRRNVDWPNKWTSGSQTGGSRPPPTRGGHTCDFNDASLCVCNGKQQGHNGRLQHCAYAQIAHICIVWYKLHSHFRSLGVHMIHIVRVLGHTCQGQRQG